MHTSLWDKRVSSTFQMFAVSARIYPKCPIADYCSMSSEVNLKKCTTIVMYIPLLSVCWFRRWVTINCNSKEL